MRNCDDVAPGKRKDNSYRSRRFSQPRAPFARIRACQALRERRQIVLLLAEVRQILPVCTSSATTCQKCCAVHLNAADLYASERGGLAEGWLIRDCSGMDAVSTANNAKHSEIVGTRRLARSQREAKGARRDRREQTVGWMEIVLGSGVHLIVRVDIDTAALSRFSKVRRVVASHQMIAARKCIS